MICKYRKYREISFKKDTTTAIPISNFVLVLRIVATYIVASTHIVAVDHVCRYSRHLLSS